ncbi:CBS domain-containing protein YhcV [Frankia sp. AiPs1]|uniref:CBS domain-containing protein n=1 Tax=Frankia sp. AiPa1 TaxID=573492 RepID=UPI00202B82A2|nr:CBS domain-containing protein [Frankia sp. AiPa1]MCL9762728.1 CBS domain-containing protein [Frankia sp. AiPa1]
MARTVADIMTRDLATIEAGEPVLEAARRMRDADAGDVIVVENGRIVGILTDRDITVRVVADGRDPANTPASQACSHELTTVSADTSIDQAVRLVRDRAVRRLPVVDGDRPVGIVSIGDLAIERDENSALGAVSAAAGNL